MFGALVLLLLRPVLDGFKIKSRRVNRPFLKPEHLDGLVVQEYAVDEVSLAPFGFSVLL